MAGKHPGGPADVSAAALAPYVTDPAWFRREPYGIHGVSHVTRVLVWSAVLASRFGAAPALRTTELYWAAATHDVGRVDDWTDAGHGTRSAEWVAGNLARERPLAAAADLEFVRELDTWHEVTDRKIGRWSAELMLFKDADGLDRVRIHDLDPAYLRTQEATRHVSAARSLEERTRHERDPLAILAVAAEQRIIRP
jgi:hypothetical protein